MKAMDDSTKPRKPPRAGSGKSTSRISTVSDLHDFNMTSSPEDEGPAKPWASFTRRSLAPSLPRARSRMSLAAKRITRRPKQMSPEEEDGMRLRLMKELGPMALATEKETAVEEDGMPSALTKEMGPDMTRKKNSDADNPHGLVDFTSTLGPSTIADRMVVKKLQENEGKPSGKTAGGCYPQPDWKPFSMRGRYLLALISISVGLGTLQEILYQADARQGVFTFRSPSDIPPITYFAVKFLPTIITVSYGVLWQFTDFEVMRLEAFYHLSKEGGALAAESINVNYVTGYNFLRPFQAMYRKHHAVAVSSIATILANVLVPTLGASSIYLSPQLGERLAHPGGLKELKISAWWSRLLTCTLFFIAVLGCVLFYQLQNRRSGLLADVQGIAGLASMAVVSHILMDFKDMDVATPQDIHLRLRGNRYVLRNASLAPDDGANPASQRERDRYDAGDHITGLSSNPHPPMLRIRGLSSYLGGVVLFAALLPVMVFTPVAGGTLSESVPSLMTALAVCVKLGWGGIESGVRMMEPYYILGRRHAPPRTLTLDYTAMPFGYVALRAALNGHVLVALVCFGTVLTEVLTVLVTSLATVEGRGFIIAAKGASRGSIDAGQETIFSFWLTLALALFVLVYLFAVASTVLARRRRVFLPRQPNSIAAVLAFIHQSKMLYDFVGTSKLNRDQMVDRLEALGKTYGFGWFQGRDGKIHCGVDQEELLSGYKSGYDYAKATNPWDEDAHHWL